VFLRGSIITLHCFHTYHHTRWSLFVMAEHDKRQTVTFTKDFTAHKVRLFEVDEDVLAAMQAGQVVIKGVQEDEAHLCTLNKTYTLRMAESTNTLLVVQPTTSTSDTQHVYASVQNVFELRLSGPRLFQLQQRLSERLYRGADEESDIRGAVYTRAQLSKLVQCSEEELQSGLQLVGAFCMNGYWRLLDPAYEARVMELLLSFAQEHGWPLDAVPLADILSVSVADVEPLVARHVLLRHGTLLPGELAVRLDPVKVALFRAEVLLRAKSTWMLNEFRDAW
jgi:sister chromatid cohesion protein DCC1